ncbi:MAG: O-antigen ligase family protein [Thermoanaerobaculia bacterium]
MAGPPAADLLAAGGALLLLVLAARLAFREPEAFWWLTVALAPLAVAWRTPLRGIELTVPLEPMLVVSAVSLVRARVRPPGGWAAAMRHPVLLLAAASVGWMAAASVAAPEPLVGFKATFIRALYAGVLLGGGLVFARGPAGARRLAAVASAALLPVALYAFVSHAAAGFARRAAFEIARPFFSNRLDLVATLTVWGVVGAALLLARGDGGPGSRARLALKALLALALVLLVALFARSALVGVGAALGAAALLSSGASARRFVAALAAGFGLVALATALFVASRSARLAPEPPAGPFSPVVDDVLSSSWLSDASILERANRWSAGFRMARARPLTGWGPNGFEPAYAHWQLAAETTVDSSWAGARGDAHSEYVTALVEQGLPGLALLLALLGALAAAGARGAGEAAPPERRSAAAAFTAALVAFAAMNLFNSFLDLDKVAPSFWLVAAAIVSLDPALFSGATPAPTTPEGC